jgi:6-pyruvoyltetrahydropterin/6-carboxytetrahydropterin synthase
MKIRVERYHDISCGHRVVGHESKCKFLHGHNYRFHFVIEGEQLDEVGRVMDFSIIKKVLCQWLEDNFDHKFLMWEKDPYLSTLMELSRESMVIVPFNPTAENIAMYMVKEIAPKLLAPYNCRLAECRIDETRKCTVSVMDN